MGVIEFEIVRPVRAPIDEVFARLVDIKGYNAWMPSKGSIRRHSEQTSPGEPGLGTTYLDHTAFGPTQGEISELERPRTLVYHWWNRSKTGTLRLEGWPGYALENDGQGTTLVRHHVIVHTHGLYRGASPFLRRMVLRERTTTMEALKASFESGR